MTDPVSLILILLAILIVVGIVFGRIDFTQAILGVILLLVLWILFGATFHR